MHYIYIYMCICIYAHFYCGEQFCHKHGGASYFFDAISLCPVGIYPVVRSLPLTASLLLVWYVFVWFGQKSSSCFPKAYHYELHIKGLFLHILNLTRCPLSLNNSLSDSGKVILYYSFNLHFLSFENVLFRSFALFLNGLSLSLLCFVLN